MQAPRVPTSVFVLLNVLVLVGIFVLGMWVGGADDSTEEPKVVYKGVYSGDFNDVKLTMQSNGNAYHWICDMHFTPEPNDEHTAECEYVDP